MDRRDVFRAALVAGLAVWATGCARVPPNLGGRVDVHLGDGPTLPTPPPSLFGHLGDALVRQLANDTANLALSPFSIGTALAMVRTGAAGRTASELDALLELDADRLAASVNTAWRVMTSAGKVELSGGNAIWAQSDYGWKPGYLTALTDFGAPLQQRDIEADPEAVRREINAWVKAETRNKIPELLAPELITPTTRMVLVNALRFAAAWLRPLHEQGRRPFRRANAAPVDAAWLVGGGPGWPWLETAQLRATAMPCGDGDFALAVLLPAEGEEVRGVLTSANLGALVKAEPASVSIGLPRFTIRSVLGLKETLAAAGVVDAFDPDVADFSPMTDRERLHVSFVQHEAVVAIDEKGIEAAAATAVGMEAGSAPAEIRELTADRPFGYALVHRPTATPLFVGVVADPTA